MNKPYVRKLPFETRAKMVELAKTQGLSGAELARRFNVDRSRVTRLLKSEGVELPRYPAPAVTAAERERIKALHQRGLSVSDIYDELQQRGEQRSLNTVREIVRAAAAEDAAAAAA